MGVRLLNRTTRSVSPTEAELRRLDRLQPALATLDDALDSRRRVSAAISQARSGSMRHALGAQHCRARRSPAMSQRFPDVVVDLVVEEARRHRRRRPRCRTASPRLGPEADMVAVPFAGAVSFICVTSPAYLERFGEPSTPDELARHRCIGHRVPNGKLYRWEFERAGQALTIDTTGPVILDDEELMVEAAIEGLGIAYVASPAAEAAVARQQLHQVLAALDARSRTDRGLLSRASRCATGAAGLPRCRQGCAVAGAACHAAIPAAGSGPS